uniref:Uncharacterized protein n=1 Tax=Meloidogyne enterolobii TaxID=390850 RepID=A0A6V7V3U3_MELEN|nr:unnamed protein product [Meloidogyne enterolobii]
MLLTTIVLFSYLITFCHSSTVEECNELFTKNEGYNTSDCKCYMDLKTCKSSLISSQTCPPSDVTSTKLFKNSSDCGMMYSECSTAEEKSCKAGMCECFKSMIDCFYQRKCTPVSASSTNKKYRSIGIIAGFSGVNKGNFGENPTELKKED